MKTWMQDGYKEYGFSFFIFALWWGMFACAFIIAPIVAILICLHSLILLANQVF